LAAHLRFIIEVREMLLLVQIIFCFPDIYHFNIDDPFAKKFAG